MRSLTLREEIKVLQDKTFVFQNGDFFFFSVATNIFHVSKHRGKSYVYQITINMWAFHLISPVRIFLNPSWNFLLEWPLKVESQSSPTNSDLII